MNLLSLHCGSESDRLRSSFINNGRASVRHNIFLYIMARYIQQEMPDLRKTGKKQTYYRLERLHTIDTDSLLDYMEHNYGNANRGTVKAVIAQLTHAISEYISLGHPVSVEGLGTFRATLGTVENPLTPEVHVADEDGVQHRNARTIAVNSVHFKVDKAFLAQVNEMTELESGSVKKLKVMKSTKEERLQKALEYLESHAVLSVSNYIALTGMARTAATLELRAFAHDPACPLKAHGRGSHRVYVK